MSSGSVGKESVSQMKHHTTGGIVSFIVLFSNSCAPISVTEINTSANTN